MWASLQNNTLEPLLNNAKDREKKYEWLQAVEYYEKASSISLKDKEFVKAAQFQEGLGYCCFRAALQADIAEDFSNRILLAKEAYEKAVEFYQKTKEPGKKVLVTNSNAMIAFYASFLEPIQSKKNKLLHEWWNLKKEVLKTYNKVGDLLALAKSCNDLLLSANFDLIWSERSKQKKMVKELVNYGEKAIEILSGVGSKYDLAWAYGLTSLYYGLLHYLKKMEDRREEDRKKSLNYIKKALELAENTGDGYLIGTLNLFAGGHCVYVSEPFMPKFFENALEQAAITRDNYLKGLATQWISGGSWLLGIATENPNEKKELYKKSIKTASDSISTLQIFNFSEQAIFTSYRVKTGSLIGLSAMETDLEIRRNLLKQAVENGLDGLKYMCSKEMQNEQILNGLGVSLTSLSMLEKEVNEKRRLLEEALKHLMNTASILQKEQQEISTYTFAPGLYFHLGETQMGLSIITKDTQKKIELLNSAFSSIENGLRINAKYGGGPMAISYSVTSNYFLGNILNQLYILTKKKEILEKAIGHYKNAIEEATKLENQPQIAEAYWQIAKIHDKLGNNLEASQKYQSAADYYKLAGEKIPQLKEFYEDFSVYMQAWSEIEKAKQSHSLEEYEQARGHYEKIATLHQLSKSWSYLAPNYLAWATMEKAEDLSRKENTREAIQTFQQAIEQFSKAKDSIQLRIPELRESDEREMATKLVESSDIRQRYCRARINIEEAKMLDRKGDYNSSSKKYSLAAENLQTFIKEIKSEEEQRELKIILVLCRAWQKMATAEEQASPDKYFEAAQLFEQAKTYSRTNKTSLLTLGNSSFCKGLAYGTQFEMTIDMPTHSMAKQHMERAATYYLKAGFQQASEYAKATQRLFDAYVYMNHAEKETDAEKKLKYYQAAEKVLQLSAASFLKAKQPEKTAQVQRILENVKEEKVLATSINEMLHAPVIASSTTSFSSPTPIGENSVGLKRFEHADVQANLISSDSEVKVGESFSLTAEFINAGREPALLTRVEDFIPADFVVVEKPEIYRLEDNCLNMKGKQLAPLKLVEAKLVLQPSKKGLYQLKPKIHYLDELGQTNSLKLKPLEIKVEEVSLADRVSTGTKTLDSLLLGGIPEGYAVVLTGPPSDERSLLIKNFLEAGTKKAQITFYITSEAAGLESLLKKRGFYLFLCNPESRTKLPDLPNISRLRSKTDLTNLNIALAKAHRSLTQNLEGSKRVCVEIVSDVLLDYGAKTTRKWLSELITDLGSKGFTILTVMNPGMHPPDQATAVLDLFDGEISLYQTEDQLECKKSIRVKKLRNQDYIKNPICLTKPK